MGQKMICEGVTSIYFNILENSIAQMITCNLVNVAQTLWLNLAAHIGSHSSACVLVCMCVCVCVSVCMWVRGVRFLLFMPWNNSEIAFNATLTWADRLNITFDLMQAWYPPQHKPPQTPAPQQFFPELQTFTFTNWIMNEWSYFTFLLPFAIL